ncbi:hypothetical protein BT93_F0340 [Corymbia citriodora subsp. variegata]|nr:hypothetical protein BT93_F0340 [Corymbia citriodora subsp. variegata]
MDPPLSHEFDSVKVEKAKAMRRYHRSRKLKILARTLELLVALVLVSWYSSGLSAAAADFLRRLATLLAKPLVVFLISNGIIGIIVFSAVKNDERQPRHEPPHIYEEDLSAPRASGGGSPGTMEAPDETHVEKQIVPYEAPPAQEKIITEVPLPVPESYPLPLTVGPAAEKGAGGEDVPRGAAEKRYRRTWSEVTTRDGEEEPRAALRRSATDNGRPRPSRRGVREEERTTPPPPSVEKLSNEEFNLTVEKYIAQTRRLLREEIMADDGDHGRRRRSQPPIGRSEQLMRRTGPPKKRE